MNDGDIPKQKNCQWKKQNYIMFGLISKKLHFGEISFQFTISVLKLALKTRQNYTVKFPSIQVRVKFGFIIIRKRYFKISKMAYKLPELPYAKDSFGGILSPETFDYHYGKHHQTYITNLNNLIKGTEWENKTLDDIVSGCKDQKIFNNAAQHWNHTFYWYCMTPEQNEPTGALKDAIVARWGSVQKCLEDFSAQAVANFGSGWTWLAKQGNDIAIVNTSNAGNPLTSNYQPLLTVDIWEHAYYIDYRNVRAKYVENFTKLINWKFVEGNFSADKVTIKL